jgi:hypothetical protein
MTWSPLPWKGDDQQPLCAVAGMLVAKTIAQAVVEQSPAAASPRTPLIYQYISLKTSTINDKKY